MSLSIHASCKLTITLDHTWQYISLVFQNYHQKPDFNNVKWVVPSSSDVAPVFWGPILIPLLLLAPQLPSCYTVSSSCWQGWDTCFKIVVYIFILFCIHPVVFRNRRIQYLVYFLVYGYRIRSSGLGWVMSCYCYCYYCRCFRHFCFPISIEMFNLSFLTFQTPGQFKQRSLFIINRFFFRPFFSLFISLSFAPIIFSIFVRIRNSKTIHDKKIPRKSSKRT